VQARIHRALGWLIAAGVLCLCGVPAQARTGDGRLSGIVLDPAGIPQLGATVWIAAEDMGDQAAAQLLTNQRGSFSSSQMRPGLYSVRVSLVGFLPALERHVRITPNLTTIVKIELGTVFDTLDSLRRAPVVPTDSDDWKWVLRRHTARASVAGRSAGSRRTRSGPPRTLLRNIGRYDQRLVAPWIAVE
jgi:hypothetical protein